MDIFDEHYLKYDAWYDRNNFAYLSELEAIKKFLPRFGRGLEIGVGTGRFARPLGISVGIDPSRNMLQIAQKRGVNVRWGLGENIVFLDKSFDYVVAVITMCFVQDPLKVLQEAYRVLKEDGSIIMGIVDRDSFLGRYYRNSRSLFYKNANFFNVKELADLAANSGFGDFSYCQTIFQLPEELKLVQKPKQGFGQGGFVAISARKKLL
ncbi:MAG: class I SAM-dependent methyltransferase [Candidatus Omnitrophica bacterium]|nr:class I SAM-dependent methyltransferase [Candidatus Omnitrophota bacterium]